MTQLEQQEEYCHYCDDTIESESAYVCDNCSNIFCNDHISEITDLCKRCYWDFYSLEEWHKEKGTTED